MPKASATATRQRVKVAVIPVLLLLLLKTLSGDSADQEPTDGAVAPPRAVVGGSKSNLPPRAHRDRHWPAITVEDAVRHNPFTFSGRRDSIPLEGDQSVATDAEPVEADVSAYFQSAKGEVALVDGQIVRVGDIVDGDWQVVTLSPESAVLAPAPAEASGR